MKLADLLIETQLLKTIKEIELIETQFDPDIGGIKIEKCQGINRSFFSELMKMPRNERAEKFDDYVKSKSMSTFKQMEEKTVCGKELLKIKARINHSNDLDKIFKDPKSNDTNDKEEVNGKPVCPIERIRHSIQFVIKNVTKIKEFVLTRKDKHGKKQTDVMKNDVAYGSHGSVLGKLKALNSELNQLIQMKNNLEKQKRLGELNEGNSAKLDDCVGNIKAEFIKRLKKVKMALAQLAIELTKIQTPDKDIVAVAKADAKKIAKVTRDL